MSATPIPISDLTLEAVTTPEEILVRCSGRIISSTSGGFQTKIRGLILESKCVVLDLTDVNYIDSSGLGALVSVYMSAKRRGRELKLINLSRRLQELFRITKLSSVFEGHGENYFEGY
jgi:anti-sigma B factor antagonist